MSSRALRKAQQARERQELERAGQADEEDASADEQNTSARAKPSLFAMLNAEVDEDEDEFKEESGAETHDQIEQSTDDEPTVTPTSKEPSRSRGDTSKKRKGKKKRPKAPPRDVDKDYDDIDAALRSLSVSKPDGAEMRTSLAADAELEEVCQLLSVDTHHLQVSNEMKRLFGSAALHDDQSERSSGQVGELMTLADAVTGRFSVQGPGLTQMLRRRNLFVQGKQEWPKAIVSGLGMEITQRRPGDITEFRFIHNDSYRRAQGEFESCVSSMDPKLMVNLLRYNPYHISTLLQVSEIAKQERDHATSGELLERALFSFGRALHSSFASHVSKGKARLDFRRPENREFWLTVRKYIENIGMRATWRTAFEWAKLLLSLDPENDPYCVSLMIDQLALRSHQAQTFLSLCRSKFFSTRWSSQPNISFSLSLAEKMATEHTTEGSKAQLALMDAIRKFPWVAARLFRELEIDKTPACIWGQTPRTEYDELTTEIYATLALDLWKPSASLSFLSTTASQVTSSSVESEDDNRAITIDEGRFVILTEKPSLISLIPRAITAKLESAADPLPPEENLPSYRIHVSYGVQGADARGGTVDELIQDEPSLFIRELDRLQAFFEQLMPRLDRSFDGTQEEQEREDISDTQLEDVISRTNLPISEVRTRLTRLVQLRDALTRQPGQRVVDEEGDEIFMDEDGMARAIFHDSDSEADIEAPLTNLSQYSQNDSAE